MSQSIDPAPIGRRRFLQSSSAIAAGVALVTSVGSEASANVLAAPRKRKSIIALNAVEINAWRAGVQVMKQRSIDDPNNPRGWLFQANMHGSSTSNPMFNLCQHGHWWFLAWHRMYIFYFEQVLLEAIGESGVPMPLDFGLPYWDYTQPASGGSSSPAAIAKRTIPQILRDRMFIPSLGVPAISNPLFDATRISSRNKEMDPSPLNASAVSITTAFGFTNFVNTSALTPSGFGGRNRATPAYFDPNRAGAFEGTPHGTVHNGVGGNMSDFETAARDPIFWTHHCNLDRLWDVWLARPMTENPIPTSIWGTQTFTFIDGTGNQITQSVAMFLNNVTGNLIDYEYDDGSTPISCPMIAFNPTTPPETTLIADGHTSQEQPMPNSTELAAFPPRFVLDANTNSVTFSIVEPAQVEIESMLANDNVGPKRLVLELNGVRVERPIDGHYEVYINLPDGAKPDFEGPHFVGNLVPFSLRAHRHPDPASASHAHGDEATADAASSSEVSVRWDISSLAKTLKKSGLWDSTGPRITFVPRGAEDVEDKSMPRITYRGLRLLKASKDGDPKNP